MTTSTDVALARLAATQHGLLSRTQIRRFGGDADFVRRRIQRGQYIEASEHVIAIAGAPGTWHQAVMAAVLSSGRSAVASHLTAAFLHGITTRRPELIDVTTPRDLRRDRPWKAHRSRDLLPHHVTSVAGIPVTAVARTVLDSAAVAPWRAERLADEAVRTSLLDYADLGRLVDEVARRGRPGIRVCRRLVGSRLGWDGRTESELEDRFRAVLTDALVPLPVAQYEIVNRAGLLICRADYAYPDRPAAVLLDGFQWHSDRAAFGKDRRVQNELTAEGWDVYRYTWWDLDLRPEAVAGQMRALALGTDAA